MNKIVFTQDLPGERDWLESQWPGSVNYQTIDSGLWPTMVPMKSDRSCIWELAPDHGQDVALWPGDKIHSVWQTGNVPHSDRWLDADSLIGNFDQFNLGSRSDKAMVYTMTRCGTVFLESILKQQCGYQQLTNWGPKVTVPIWPNQELVDTISHTFPHSPGHEIQQAAYHTLEQHHPDVFFVYRSNWWQWLTSFLLHQKLGRFHYNTAPDFDSISPVVATTQDIDHCVNVIKSGFVNMCNVRLRFPKLNFYIYDYADLVKNQHLTEHRQIDYDKNELIANVTDLYEYFEHSFRAKIEVWHQRFRSHMSDMRCSFCTDFDWAMINQKA